MLLKLRIKCFAHFSALLSATIVMTLLSGCAGIIVGGAATSVALLYDRRTVGTMVEDETIELKAIKAVLGNDTLRLRTHVNITSYNMIVLLTGETPSNQLRSKVSRIVSKIPKVKRIINEIVLSAPSAMVSRSSDTLVTARVKTGLLSLSNVKAPHIKVVTEDGTVYLMGLLHKHEVRPVVEYVRTVPGVQRVIKLFEMLD